MRTVIFISALQIAAAINPNREISIITAVSFGVIAILALVADSVELAKK